MKIVKKVMIVLLLLTMLGVTGCRKEENTVLLTCVDDLKGHPLGAITGGISSKMISRDFPESEKFEFATIADATAALKQKKVDGVPFDLGVLKDICANNDDLTYFAEPIMPIEYGSIFTRNEKGKARCIDYNAFLLELDNEGELEKIRSKWFDEGSNETFDFSKLIGENGTLVFATDGMAYPMSFSCDGQLTGMEIELVYRYCLKRGYALDIEVSNFGGMLASVSSGKADIGASSIIYSEERGEAFYFSDFYASSSYHMMVRKENMANKLNSLEDLKGQKIADITGSICAPIVEEKIEDASVEFYSSTSDIVEAVLEEKVVAGLLTEATYSSELAERDDLRVLDTLGYEECGYFFQYSDEGNALKKQLNAFLKESEENGYLKELNAKWEDESTDKHLDYSLLTGENGTLKYACCSTIGEPACYVYDNAITGKEVEFVYEFAKSHGYGLELVDYSFIGMIQAVSSNMADIGGSNTAITSERSESVNFSKPLYKNAILVIVKNTSNEKEEISFIDTVKESFEKTFIREDRYKLFIEGVLATLEISLLSIVFGLLLGIVFFAFYYLKNPTINKVMDFVSSLLSEMPTVVLLMVFYYIVFSKSALGGLEVSIIAFSILFAVMVLGNLKTCFASVDKGQYEAAWALGYGRLEAVIKIIVPEILPMFFTLFVGEIVSLIKATSIVGYIAVQDVTKISDIVRSRTYEPFFPLIVTTILYIIVIWLFKSVVGLLAKRLDTRKTKKSNLLKGVKTDD